MKYYLEFCDEKSNKFWEISLEGSGFIVRFGKIGTAGQIQQKNFENEQKAQKEAEKLVAKKRKDGYVDVQKTDAKLPPKKVKRETFSPPIPPEIGPLPLTDDGKEKPWYDEDKIKIFELERMRAGLDETAKEDDNLKEIVVAEAVARVELLVKAYEMEDSPHETFCTAASYAHNRMEKAVFLYENLIKPMGEEVCTSSLSEAVSRILRGYDCSKEDIEMLRWLTEQELFTTADFDMDEDDIRIPVYVDYLQELNKGKRGAELDKFINIKIEEYLEPTTQFIEDSLRELLSYARNGTQIEVSEKTELAKIMPNGHFPKDTYGLGVCVEKRSLKFGPWSPGNMRGATEYYHEYIRIEDLPENIVKFFYKDIISQHLKKTMPIRLEAMYNEGLFDDHFVDFFVFKADTSHDVIFSKELRAGAIQEFNKQVELLETSTDWKENAKILVSVICKLCHGVTGIVESERALTIVKRHLSCPDEVARQISKELLDHFSLSAFQEWEFEKFLMSIEEDSYADTAYFAKRHITIDGIKAAEEILANALQELENIRKERSVLKTHVTNIPNFVQVERLNGTFEEIFEENDLFTETENIIIRAYKDGKIVIRFLIEGEEGYGEALDFINKLLIKNYAEKTKSGVDGGFELNVRFLHEPMPIKQMAKAEVSKDIGYPFSDSHAFFARAVQYNALRPKVENYAMLALQSNHWYTDLDGEDSTVPGTFAATALAFCGLEYMPLVCRYASVIDGDHSYIHAALPKMLLQYYGPVPEIFEAIFSLCGLGEYDIILPRKIFADGDTAAALVNYLRSVDKSEEEKQEYLCSTMACFVGYYDERRNLKTLANYVATAETQQDKNAIIDLHNMYLQACKSMGYGGVEDLNPFPQVEGYQ